MKAEHLIGFFFGGCFGSIVSAFAGPVAGLVATTVVFFGAAMLIGMWQERGLF